MSVDQAMILAAGKGERMLPLTKNLPKPLLPIGDTTLIQRHLQALSEAGVSRVVINIHYLADMIVEVLGNEQYGMEILYSREQSLLETAGGIINALPILGDSPFIIVNGDIYTDFPFSNLVQRDHDTRQPHLVMVNNPAHHVEGDFSVDETGVLHATKGKLKTYSGIAVYQADFFKNASSGKLKLRTLFDVAVKHGQLFGEYYDGLWIDIGSPERYQALTAQLR